MWAVSDQYIFTHLSSIRHKVLVVGQTPPPFGGQAVMIRALLNGTYDDLEFKHVRLAFSADMDSVGKFKVKKIWILFATILQILWARVSTGAKTIYYPPSGPEKVPVIRDIILLNCVRWAFSKTVFHFHAGGVSGFRNELSGVLRYLFDRAYCKPDLAIRTSELNPDDGAGFGAKKSVVVYNGLEDEIGSVLSSVENKKVQLLFVGVLIPSKGVMVLMEVCGLLVQNGFDLEIKVMGRFGSQEFEKELKNRIQDLGLTEIVEFVGVKSGNDKFKYFASCDIFCFPSYFESESFGLVCAEAMMFSKPIVSTNWRGIPTVVQNGVNGYLVPIKDPIAFANKVEALIKDPQKRQKMGEAGRRIYEECFTIEKFRANMETALCSIY